MRTLASARRRLARSQALRRLRHVGQAAQRLRKAFELAGQVRFDLAWRRRRLLPLDVQVKVAVGAHHNLLGAQAQRHALSRASLRQLVSQHARHCLHIAQRLALAERAAPRSDDLGQCAAT